MKKYQKILLSALSGVLLAPAFYEWGTGFILFIALVPLLAVEDNLSVGTGRKKRNGFLWYAVITFMLFTLLTVWWVKNAVFIALVASLIVNTSFMVAPFLFFHYIKRKSGARLGYLSLVVLWISFEYLFLNVQVNFPWIILGNAFANDVKFIQWYDVTGTLGGSLWVLIMNLLVYDLFKGLRKKLSFEANRGKISWLLGFLLVPVIISLVRFYTYEEEYRPYECIVLQPNIDPWEKFVDIPPEQQTAYLLEEARSFVSGSTDYIIGPETFFNTSVWQESFNQHPEIQKVYTLVDQYPRVKFIIGAMTLKRYEPGEPLTPTAKSVREGAFYYDSFNSALQIDTTRKIQMYHKSLLVTGVEWMPTFKKFKFIENIAIKMGGISRSHATQEERGTFISPQDGLKVAPVICWESIFGEYVTEYVREKGAGLIFIITNDGWWKNTPGHRQHNRYARLRAIETRRSIARSANTGISSMINQRGEEIQRIGWWERSAIKGELNANDHLTFYVKHGDYIARISAFMSVLLLVYAFVRSQLSRKESKKNRKLV